MIVSEIKLDENESCTNVFTRLASGKNGYQPIISGPGSHLWRIDRGKNGWV